MSAAKCQLNEAELKLLKEKQARGVTVVGIDLATRVIQVCYLQKNGTLYNKPKTRDEFIKFLEEPPFTGKILAGIEACGSCNFWARKIKALGHDCKVMPAFQIKAFLSLDTKTDKVDALAILRAVMSVSIKEIGIRDEKNQVLMQLLTVREQLMKQKVQIQNARRAVLYELGEVCSLGENAIDECAQKLLVSLEKSKSEALSEFSSCDAVAKANLNNVNTQLNTIEKHLTDFAKNDPVCQNLITIPGIALLSAAVLRIVMGDPNDYPDSRHFAAFVGFAPKVTGSGGKVSVGGTRKSGNRILKRVLYMCAIVRYGQTKKHDPERTSKVATLIDNEDVSNKRIVCSIANRMARVAWTLAKHGEKFDGKKCRLLGL